MRTAACDEVPGMPQLANTVRMKTKKYTSVATCVEAWVKCPVGETFSVGTRSGFAVVNDVAVWRDAPIACRARTGLFVVICGYGGHAWSGKRRAIRAVNRMLWNMPQAVSDVLTVNRIVQDHHGHVDMLETTKGERDEYQKCAASWITMAEAGDYESKVDCARNALCYWERLVVLCHASEIDPPILCAADQALLLLGRIA